jgi:hypothetical protein
LSALSTKRKERTGQDYNVLLCTVVAGTLGAVAGCLYRRAFSRKRKNTLLPYYSHFRKHEEKFPKMANMTKNTLKSPNIY